MQKEDFERAQRILARIDEYEKMDAALRSAAQKVKKEHKKSDADELAALIMELVETKENEILLDYIVSTFALRFDELKCKLRKEFEEL